MLLYKWRYSYIIIATMTSHWCQSESSIRQWCRSMAVSIKSWKIWWSMADNVCQSPLNFQWLYKLKFFQHRLKFFSNKYSFSSHLIPFYSGMVMDSLLLTMTIKGPIWWILSTGKMVRYTIILAYSCYLKLLVPQSRFSGTRNLLWDINNFRRLSTLRYR